MARPLRRAKTGAALTGLERLPSILETQVMPPASLAARPFPKIHRLPEYRRLFARRSQMDARDR